MKRREDGKGGEEVFYFLFCKKDTTGFFSDVSTRDAHRQAHVGFTEGWSIVCSVSSDCHYLSLFKIINIKSK